jgi:hypothetical protein
MTLSCWLFGHVWFGNWQENVVWCVWCGHVWDADPNFRHIRRSTEWSGVYWDLVFKGKIYRMRWRQWWWPCPDCGRRFRRHANVPHTFWGPKENP